MINTQPFEALCRARSGATATLPATASDETIEGALAKVLQVRMEYITQSSNPDFARQAENLAHYLMQYANSCGQHDRVKELPRKLTLNGPTAAECEAFNKYIRECGFVRTTTKDLRRGPGSLQIGIGRLWSIFHTPQLEAPGRASGPGVRG